MLESSQVAIDDTGIRQPGKVRTTFEHIHEMVTVGRPGLKLKQQARNHETVDPRTVFRTMAITSLRTPVSMWPGMTGPFSRPHSIIVSDRIAVG